MKSNKFSSLEELKEEARLKTEVMAKEIVRLPIKIVSTFCLKHNQRAKQCARLGNRLTKLRRLHKQNIMFSTPLVLDRQIDRAEEDYRLSKIDFHKEFCTCNLDPMNKKASK